MPTTTTASKAKMILLNLEILIFKNNAEKLIQVYLKPTRIILQNQNSQSIRKFSHYNGRTWNSTELWIPNNYFDEWEGNNFTSKGQGRNQSERKL